MRDRKILKKLFAQSLDDTGHSEDMKAIELINLEVLLDIRDLIGEIYAEIISGAEYDDTEEPHDEGLAYT